MINFILLHSSLYILGHSFGASYTKKSLIKECNASFFLNSLMPFNVTPSLTKTVSLIIEPPQQISLIPKSFVNTANNIGQVSSVASAIAISPSNVVQASRNTAILSITNCQDGTKFTNKLLAWNESPTQISLGNSVTQYVDGAVFGNWLLFGASAAIHKFAAYKISEGDTRLQFPGFLMGINLFLATTTIASGIKMIRFGDDVEKAFGAISVTAQTASVVGIGIFLKNTFSAKTEYFNSDLPTILKPILSLFSLHRNIEYVSSDPSYVAKYGMLFKDYKPSLYWFIVPDLTMTLTLGVLDSFGISTNSCNSLIYATTAVQGIYTISLLVFTPHLTLNDKVYFSFIATGLFISTLLESLQRAIPELENNVIIKTTAEAIPIALQFLTLCRSIFDLSTQIYSLYKTYNIKLTSSTIVKNRLETSELVDLLDNSLLNQEQDNQEITELSLTFEFDEPVQLFDRTSISSDSPTQLLDCTSISSNSPTHSPEPSLLFTQNEQAVAIIGNLNDYIKESLAEH